MENYEEILDTGRENVVEVLPKDDTIGYILSLQREASMLSERLAAIGKDVENLQTRMTEFQSELSGVKSEIGGVRKDMTGNFRWIVGTIITIFALIVGVISFQASWFQDALSKNWAVAQDALKRIDASQSRIERMEIKQELNEEYSYPRPRIPSPKPQSK